jgi:hypothetical protein
MNLFKSLVVSAGILCVSILGANAAVLTSFGSGDFTHTYNDFTSFTQDSTSLRLVGNDFGSSTFGNLTAPFDLGGSMDAITLSGSYSGASTARFDVILIDEDGDTRNYTGYFSFFSPGVPSTVTLAFNFAEGVFDGPVRSVGIVANGIGSAVDLTVYNIAAIPEPSTWALILIGATGAAIVIRRRKIVA